MTDQRHPLDLAPPAPPIGSGRREAPPWKILIADDEVQFHRALAFALDGQLIVGRAVQLLHAYSAAEAQTVVAATPDLAVILLDVVMESEHAGLELVPVLRERLGRTALRIVLLTAQPGRAPELEVIHRYDINDYRTKDELDQHRLISSLTVALRAYLGFSQLDAHRRGLDAIMHACNRLFRERHVEDFADRLLESLAELTGWGNEGFVCIAPSAYAGTVEQGMQVLRARGRYVRHEGQALEDLADATIIAAVRSCTAARQPLFLDDGLCLHLGNGSQREAVVYLPLEAPLPTELRQLLAAFASSVSVGFDNVELVERLDFFAFHDPLTRLPNRVSFLTEVEQLLLARANAPRVLALLDLVDFSDLNDALGHRAGDALLVAVGRRLRTRLVDGVRVARISGAIFGLFGADDDIDPEALRASFDEPFYIAGHALRVDLRLGLTRLEQARGGALDLVRQASLALGQARGHGCGYAYYGEGMAEALHARVGLLSDLRAAIDYRRGLSLSYQPLVCTSSGQTLEVEALLRWRDRHGEDVAPERIIPLAERTGLIHELGHWVLELALVDWTGWRAAGLQPPGLAINLSPVQLRSDEFVERLQDLLRRYDFPPAQLTLEVTESIALEDHGIIDQRLQTLHDLGVKLAVDDFGTGFSSLAQLVRLPAGCIKIDRSFVRDLGLNASAEAVIASILVLARGRGLDVVAEGVERNDQLERLRALGCELMQGFLFAPPLSPQALCDWLRERADPADD